MKEPIVTMPHASQPPQRPAKLVSIKILHAPSRRPRQVRPDLPLGLELRQRPRQRGNALRTVPTMPIVHRPGQARSHLRVRVPGHSQGPSQVCQLLGAEGGHQRNCGGGHAPDQGGAQRTQRSHGPGGVCEVLLVELGQLAQAGGLNGGDQRGAGQVQGGDGPGGVGEGLGGEGVDAGEAGGGEHCEGWMAGGNPNHCGPPEDVGQALSPKLDDAIRHQPQQMLPPRQSRHRIWGLLAHLPHPVHSGS
mmetsp:Transcript_2053/g.4779  ORF Transcript_2053/g.4779 Transcript_2053/m.4779 type:complete len:248 (+) Transcript_2053:427-1170(+)